MATFIYSPGIRVHVQTTRGTIDVSDDLESGNLSVAENNIGVFSFSLVNHRRKYDGVFRPNDRITVQMKRTRWVQVFAGYLDSVPYFSVYPRSVPLRASDANKKLKFTLWDAGSDAAMQLLRSDSRVDQDDRSMDGAIGNRIMTILTTPELGGLDQGKVHIGNIPDTWWSKVSPLYDAVTKLLSGRDNVVDTNTTAGSSTGGNGPATLAGIPDDYLTLYNKYSNVGPGLDWALLAATGWIETNHGQSTQVGVHSGQNSAGAKGPMQFLQPTFDSVKSKYDLTGRGKGTGDIYTPNDAICAAAHYLLDSAGGDLSSYDNKRKGIFAYNHDTNYVNKVLDKRLEYLKAAGQTTASSATDASVNGTVVPGNNTSGTKTGQFIDAAKRGIGIPYQQENFDDYTSNTLPKFFDCSSLVMWALYQVGIEFPRVSGQQYAACTKISLGDALKTAGALLFAGNAGSDHVAISLGDGHSTLQARKTGTTVSIVDSIEGFNFNAAGLIPALGAEVGTQYDGSNSIGPGDNSQLINKIEWGGGSSLGSRILFGPLALMNDEPILGTVQTLCHSSMRSWMAAPNGDFISWFPDYFGTYNLAAKMRIEDIELANDGFTVMWSDDNLITHQYTAGSPYNISFSPDDAVSLYQQYETAGVVSVDMTDVMATLFNLDPKNAAAKEFLDAATIYQRYGARKNYTAMGNAYGKKAEFWFALFLFQRNWASQFSAAIQVTFMPEVYPGMLVYLPSYGFQAYVEAVQHSFDFRSGGLGFSTQISITAPSSTTGSGLLALPRGN